MKFCGVKTLMISAIILVYSHSVAQNIRVADHSKREYSAAVPVFRAQLDTLHILFRVTQMGMVRLQQYSAVNPANLPADFAILLQTQIGNNIDWRKDGRLLLYHFRFAGQTIRSIWQYAVQNNNCPNWLVNPFLNDQVEIKYHILFLEVRNLWTYSLQINPQLISITLQNGERRFNLQPEELFDDIESEKVELSEKILRENLFIWRPLAPGQYVAGLVCFPLKNRDEKIVEATMGRIKYFSANKRSDYFPVHLKTKSKILEIKKK